MTKTFDESKMEPVFELIREERRRQFEKWGNQKHNRFVWLVILLEELGEAAKAALHDVFGGYAKGTFKAEMIQLAAVAVQVLERYY